MAVVKSERVDLLVLRATLIRMRKPGQHINRSEGSLNHGTGVHPVVKVAPGTTLSLAFTSATYQSSKHKMKEC